MNEQQTTVIAEAIHEFTSHLNKISNSLRDFRMIYIDATDTIRILRASESIHEVISWYQGLFTTVTSEEITPEEREQQLSFIHSVIKSRTKAALTHLVEFCAKHRNGSIDLTDVRNAHEQILSLELREEVTIKEILTANAEQL